MAVADKAAHALVTGGGRGIGAAIASALLEQGFRVTLTARNAAPLASWVAAQSGGQTARCQAVSMDVADRPSVDQAFSAARATFGPVAVLVNNAGQAASASFMQTDADLLQRMLNVNLVGAYHCMQVALPDMLAAKSGRIINIASTAALVGYAYVTAYTAAKHGVLGLTRALALELAGKGITVNAVCPGYTETDIVKDAVATIVAKTGRSAQQARTELAKSNPMGRLVQPHEVANAVVWLAGQGASSVTGQAIAVCGGEVT